MTKKLKVKRYVKRHKALIFTIALLIALMGCYSFKVVNNIQVQAKYNNDVRIAAADKENSKSDILPLDTSNPFNVFEKHSSQEFETLVNNVFNN